MKIIFATGNQDKMREIREIFADLNMEILSMKEAGISVDVKEDGKTFEENAILKARSVATALPAEDEETIVMADDSGLVIDALDGEPGIYSSRYMGEKTSYHIKNNNLIQRLMGVPDEKRTARFVCAIAAILPDGEDMVVRGTIEGWIGYEERGVNGFGYDPIFWLPGKKISTAEIPPEEKNGISHRGNALRSIRTKLEAKGYGR